MMQRVEFIDPNNAGGIAAGSLVYGRAIVAENAAMEIDRLIRLAGGL